MRHALAFNILRHVYQTRIKLHPTLIVCCGVQVASHNGKGMGKGCSCSRVAVPASIARCVGSWWYSARLLYRGAPVLSPYADSALGAAGQGTGLLNFTVQLLQLHCHCRCLPLAVTATGAPENWYTRAAACSSCSSAPTVACLACTVRFGNPVSITVPGVTAGRAYTLRFTFSEVWWTEAGRRSFDVTVGGAPVLARVDVFDAAQARFVGVVREVNVTAASGSLAVGLAATADNAIIAALEVRAQHTCDALAACTNSSNTTASCSK